MLRQTKQVNKEHYDFQRYMRRARWNSVWNQLHEVLSLQPASVLEVGPGPGLFKSNAQQFGLNIETVDIDPELKPDHLGSVTELPFADNSYDLVCAFQVLEHMPYADSLKAFSEMVRVSKHNVVLSLPNALKVWRLRIDLPQVFTWQAMVRRPFAKPEVHVFDGQHFWEINKQESMLDSIEADFGAHADLLRSYQLYENPYHHFFVYQKPTRTNAAD